MGFVGGGVVFVDGVLVTMVLLDMVLLEVAVMVWRARAAGGLVLVTGDIGGVKIMGEAEEEGGVAGGVMIIAVVDVAIAVAALCAVDVGRGVDDAECTG